MTAAEIRLASGDDAAAVRDIYAPLVTDTAVSFELAVPSVEEMRRRIESTLPTLPWLVCSIDGEVAGYAYAGRHRERAAYRWSVEVSAYVAEPWRRRGVARGLYTALLEILSVQGFHTACAGVALPNPASVALHESLGFAPIGVYREIGFKFGKWHDVGWWQRRLGDHVVGPPPSPPKPVEAIADTPSFAEAMRLGLDRLMC